MREQTGHENKTLRKWRNVHAQAKHVDVSMCGNYLRWMIDFVIEFVVHVFLYIIAPRFLCTC